MHKTIAAALVAATVGACFAPGPAVAQESDGWLFLGRRGAEGWRPASPSLASPRYPVKPGQRLVVRQDALFYDAVDCKVTDAADFKPAEAGPREVLRVKADAAGLQVVAAPLECPSAGHAKTVWAKVRVPDARLVKAEK